MCPTIAMDLMRFQSLWVMSVQCPKCLSLTLMTRHVTSYAFRLAPEATSITLPFLLSAAKSPLRWHAGSLPAAHAISGLVFPTAQLYYRQIDGDDSKMGKMPEPRRGIELSFIHQMAEA